MFFQEWTAVKFERYFNTSNMLGKEALLRSGGKQMAMEILVPGERFTSEL